jgi:LysR family transcriptional regulator, benzoate and cis,cis-muconate-responsive activator of ben and cat genes
MGSFVDTRLQLAAITLAEELNYTRAAARLRITQPALSKQIAELERQLGFSIFRRSHHRIDITEAGQLFVNGCRLSLAQLEKAVHLARAANNGAGYTLTIGNSPHIDSNLISTALSITLPLYPYLKLRLESMFVLELVHSLLASEIDLALVTGASGVITTYISSTCSRSHLRRTAPNACRSKQSRGQDEGYKRCRMDSTQ